MRIHKADIPRSTRNGWHLWQYAKIGLRKAQPKRAPHRRVGRGAQGKGDIGQCAIRDIGFQPAPRHRRMDGRPIGQHLGRVGRRQRQIKRDIQPARDRSDMAAAAQDMRAIANHGLPNLDVQCRGKGQPQIDLRGIEGNGARHPFDRCDGDIGQGKLACVAAAIGQKIGKTTALKAQQRCGKIKAVKGDTRARRIIAQPDLKRVKSDGRRIMARAELARADIKAHSNITHRAIIGQLPLEHARDWRAHQIDPSQRRTECGDIARGQTIEGKDGAGGATLRAARQGDVDRGIAAAFKRAAHAQG